MQFLLRVESNLLKLFVIFFLAGFYSFVYAGTSSHEPTTPTVLLLNSYHPQYAWTEKLTKGVQDALESSIPTENLHVEYMDSRNFIDDPHYAKHLKSLIQYKYKKIHPDLIITSDDHAFHFMLEHGETMFPNVPVVFSGVNVLNEADLIGRDNVTGILEGIEIEGNLKLIEKMHPNIKKIIMIGDKTGLGHKMVQSARKIQVEWQADNNKQNIELEILDRFTLDELYEKAQNVSPNTAFLMLAIHKDMTGQYFSFENELPQLSHHSAAPIYGMWGAIMIGNGIVGGLINNPYKHGNRAGNIALTILSGVAPSDIPIQKKSIFSPEFDYNQLKRFKVRLDRLPKGSLIHNQPQTLYEKNKLLVNGVIACVLFLVGIITVLIQNIRQRELAQDDLASLNQQLERKIEQRTTDLQARNAELESINERMEKMAHTDVLTGMGNRRAANIEIESYAHRSNINHEKFSLAILDIDFFKRVNDTYGHQIGDDVLFQVSQIIKHALRPSDRVYRWGGEEFLLALPNTAEQFSMAVCQRVRKCINEYEHPIIGKVTASIGVTTLLETDSIDTLIHRCDGYLYFAKENGRDQVVATGSS